MHAFEAAAHYVQNYVQGGRILIKHQAVALRIADMATRIEAVRALLDRGSKAVDDNAPDADMLCNMVEVVRLGGNHEGGPALPWSCTAATA